MFLMKAKTQIAVDLAKKAAVNNVEVKKAAVPVVISLLI